MTLKDAAVDIRRQRQVRDHRIHHPLEAVALGDQLITHRRIQARREQRRDQNPEAGAVEDRLGMGDGRRLQPLPRVGDAHDRAADGIEYLGNARILDRDI